MANPAGKNQLAPAYGEVKRMNELTRSAPISGAPISGRAIDTARRVSKQAQRAQPQSVSAAGPSTAAPAATIPQSVPYRVQLAMIWREIAATPGASPQVQELADQAEKEAGLG